MTLRLRAALLLIVYALLLALSGVWGMRDAKHAVPAAIIVWEQ